ncbi:MAG: hypothetical protein IJ249_06315 [Paludibacteraceae bacterium]|nr:hypothetical protein [Paludibacteraceae bacterium]
MRNSSNGYLEINGGSMISNSSTSHNNGTTQYYAVISHGTFLMTGGKISGVQGALSISQSGATARIEGGEFETRHGVDGQNNNHYALHVAVGAVVNVFGGKFKVETPSAGGNQVVLIGDNDTGTTFGIINLYGGTYQQKPYLSKRKAQDAEMIYPASIPATSQWYSSFGTNVPLPVGYEYEAIESGADYDLGYRWRVICTNTDTKEVIVDDPEATIPWQQQTTWKADWEEGQDEVVPEKTTIVTIPVDATVVVKNDPNMDPNAVAEQVFVNQGATLTVETGTTLKIGEGGVNIANSGQIVVEPDAIVTVGDAGIVTTEDEAIIIEASEQEQGVLLLNPAVTENTRPKATVKLVTKSKQIAENDFIYERFAIPTYDGETTTFSIEGGTAGIVTYNGDAFGQGLYGWSYDTDDWVGLGRFKDMKPFNGYQLTNNSLNGGVTYVFEGNLVGNHDENYTFSKAGFGFFGNSYTGAIDIKNFLEDFGGDMQKSIWIYDYITDGFKIVTEDNYGTVKYGSRRNPQGFITEIRSMQAFIMYRGAIGSQAVDYSNAIWGNPKYGLVEVPAGAPAKRVAEDADHMTVYVFSGNKEDEVTLIRSNEYSNEFDNGADASKWMNKSMNLYIAGEENLAILASDNIDNTTIAFQSGKETEYTIGFADLRGEEYILRDVLTGAMIQMVEGAEYTFTQEANTTVPARFQVIAPARIPTGVENVENAPVMQKVMLNGTLYILRDNKWYSVQGQNVK